MKSLWPIGFLVLLTLAGCSSSRQDEVSQWMAQEKSQTQPRVQPIKEPAVFQPISYDRGDMVNPFSFQKLSQVFMSGDARRGLPQWVVDAQNRRKEALEAYPLDTMQMVGFMKKKGKPTALMSVDGHLYQVVPGNYLGQNLGRIVSITESQLDLKEVVQDATGDWTERSTQVFLQE